MGGAFQINLSPGRYGISVDGGVEPMFSRAVSSVQPASHVVKFFLSRWEPSLKAENKMQAQPVAQVAMSTVGFLQMAVFFEITLRDLLQAGYVTQEQVNAQRAMSEQMYKGRA